MKSIIAFVLLSGIVIGSAGLTFYYYGSENPFVEKNLQIKILKVEIMNTQGVDIDATIFIEVNTKNALKVQYGCSHPFNINIMNNKEIAFGYIECLAIMTHDIPAGVSNYNITGSFSSNDGTILPEFLHIQAVLGSNLAESPIFILNTKNL